MKKSRAEPTTTAFAILGMLAIRSMTPYELSKSFDRSLGRFWPRARSKLFEIPKHLVDIGYARSTPGRTGRRPRTVYTITPAGRRALAAWLAEPGAGPEVDFEQLLKVFFAEHGSKDAVLANLEAARTWAQMQIEEHVRVARSYLDGTGPFPERAAQLTVTGAFLAEFAMTVDRWSGWALDIARAWPDDPSEATPDLAALRAVLRRLETSQTRGAGDRDRTGMVSLEG
jgi:PadR family transcriptional regulator, regulatory protein AphA